MGPTSWRGSQTGQKRTLTELAKGDTDRSTRSSWKRSNAVIPPGMMAVLSGLCGGPYLATLLYVFARHVELLFPIAALLFMPMIGFSAYSKNAFLRMPAYVLGGMGFESIFTACVAGGLSGGTMLIYPGLVFGVIGLWLGGTCGQTVGAANRAWPLICGIHAANAFLRPSTRALFG